VTPFSEVKRTTRFIVRPLSKEVNQKVRYPSIPPPLNPNPRKRIQPRSLASKRMEKNLNELIPKTLLIKLILQGVLTKRPSKKNCWKKTVILQKALISRKRSIEDRPLPFRTENHRM